MSQIATAMLILGCVICGAIFVFTRDYTVRDKDIPKYLSGNNKQKKEE